jgi:S-DNA-T family DNA segregation ATPase FtsK/SpoIIIE
MGNSNEADPRVDEPFFVLRGGSAFEKVRLPRVGGAVT